ncbi:MAG: hypothetical protein O2923_01620 [Verrucomicrobia bacterium]|nr:hypothetical protein [Verrucomicrobiota bacterium]MDA1085685.1 hypothetical protein [Verrucomicrobiota bacterium]
MSCGHDPGTLTPHERHGIAYIYKTDEGWAGVQPLIVRTRTLGTVVAAAGAWSRPLVKATRAVTSPNSSSTGKHNSTAHASPSTDLAIEAHARGAMLVTPEDKEA